MPFVTNKLEMFLMPDASENKGTENLLQSIRALVSVGQRAMR